MFFTHFVFTSDFTYILHLFILCFHARTASGGSTHCFQLVNIIHFITFALFRFYHFVYIQLLTHTKFPLSHFVATTNCNARSDASRALRVRLYIYVYLVCCVCFMCAYYNLCLMNHYSTLFSSFGFNREIELASLAFRHRLELVTYDLHLLLFALTYSL